jgi:hypothetical protein
MNPIRKVLVGAAIVGSTLTGGAIGAALLHGTATAQSTTSTTVAPPSGGAPGDRGRTFDPAKGGHVGANGVREQLLTGDDAEKVRAAAVAAVPGGTVERVETDAEGSPYEAHMTKADGTRVTVKVDGAFKATSVDNGPR